MAEITNAITISIGEYDELTACKLYYSLILDTAYKSANLSYDGERLIFSQSKINNLLEQITPVRYWRVFMKLKEEQDERLNQDAE